MTLRGVHPAAAHQPSTSVDLIGRRSTPLKRVSNLTEEIANLQGRREVAIAEAIAAGATWTQIASILGVSPQAAHKRYRWLRHSPVTGETWREPKLPGTKPASAGVLLVHAPGTPRATSPSLLFGPENMGSHQYFVKPRNRGLACVGVAG